MVDYTHPQLESLYKLFNLHDQLITVNTPFTVEWLRERVCSNTDFSIVELYSSGEIYSKIMVAQIYGDLTYRDTCGVTHENRRTFNSVWINVYEEIFSTNQILLIGKCKGKLGGTMASMVEFKICN